MQGVARAVDQRVPPQPLLLFFPQSDAGEVVRDLLLEELRHGVQQAAQIELRDHGVGDLEQQPRAVARAAQLLLALAQRGVGGPLVERRRQHVGQRVEQVPFFAQERALGRRRPLLQVHDIEAARACRRWSRRPDEIVHGVSAKPGVRTSMSP